MALYMTQKMSSGTLTPITYYRKQSQEHPSHDETGKFTQDAEADYANTYGIPLGNVEPGNFKSSQGVPTGGETRQI